MTQLAVYLIGVGLVVLGALAFIAALRIAGRIRMVIACLMACVPVTAGVHLFHSSGLKISDFQRLLRSANQQMEQMGQGIRQNRQAEKEAIMLLGR